MVNDLMGQGKAEKGNCLTKMMRTFFEKNHEGYEVDGQEFLFKQIA